MKSAYKKWVKGKAPAIFKLSVLPLHMSVVQTLNNKLDELFDLSESFFASVAINSPLPEYRIQEIASMFGGVLIDLSKSLDETWEGKMRRLKMQMEDLLLPAQYGSNSKWIKTNLPKVCTQVELKEMEQSQRYRMVDEMTKIMVERRTYELEYWLSQQRYSELLEQENSFQINRTPNDLLNDSSSSDPLESRSSKGKLDQRLVITLLDFNQENQDLDQVKRTLSNCLGVPETWVEFQILLDPPLIDTPVPSLDPQTRDDD